MTIFYDIPQLPDGLRPNSTESELSFIAPLPRKNYVINPSFEVDLIGETQPYNWDVGTYAYANNTISSITDIGSVVTENVYSGFNAMRCNFGSDTTVKFVYGRTQPISLPLSAKKGAFYSTHKNRTLYRVSGALSFYVFAPVIDPYTQFELFNQSAGASRNFTVQIYATVDSNGEPTANFSQQQIITNASVPITVSKSTFYSKEIEPNYIGRRKNPQWVRHVIPFSTIYDYQNSNFLRFAISSTAPGVGENSNFLFYLDAVQVEFYDDDFPFYTTYLDGDLGVHDPLHPSGYYWEGANQKSISVRSMEAYSGGVMFNLQKDFMINIVNMRGFGLPAPSNNVTPYEYADGQQYVSTGIDSRQITINGYVSGDTALESNRATGILQYLLSKERSGVSNLRRFYYRIPADLCGGSSSEYVFFDAVVESIKPDPESNNPGFNVVIQLNNINIYYYTSNNVYYTQSALQPSIQSSSTYGVKLFHAQGGNAFPDITYDVQNLNSIANQSFFGYENYDLSCNGEILCWCELNNGCILFGGKFSSVTYKIENVSVTVPCKNIAMLTPEGKVLSIKANINNSSINGVTYQRLSGTRNDTTGGAAVRAIIQTNLNTIMIGGSFDCVVGRTEECANIWHVTSINENGIVEGANIDVEGGLISNDNNGGIFTLLYVPIRNAIYVGGNFTRTSTGSSSTRLKNAAIYYFDREYKWEPMWYGANNTVTTMTWFQNRYVVCGGLFTAWNSSTSNELLKNTKYAAVYDTAASTADNVRVKSLSSIVSVASTATLPVINPVFNGAVNKMVTDNFGNVIIGGQFTYVDMNTEANVAHRRLTTNRIVRWDGFDRYTLMETGVSSGTDSFWRTTTGTISTTVGNATVTGTNVQFTSADVGARIYTLAGDFLGVINSITLAALPNSCVLSAGATATYSGGFFLEVFYTPPLVASLLYPIVEVSDVCTCPYTHDVYVVGTFTNVGNIKQAFGVARWTKNRWEALDFELQAASMYSVFVSKRGYGFISYSTANNYVVVGQQGRTNKILNWNLNSITEPNLIVIDNFGLETQPIIELSNPTNNQDECDLISIYNLSNHKSMTFNMKVFVGETITIDFSEPNVRPKSNVRNRIINSLVGGGTFSNFFLSEGKNIIKVMGGQRGIDTSAFVRPLEVKIRYHTRQISPYVVNENDIISRQDELTGWTLNKSKLGLDTVPVNVTITNPSYTGQFTLESTIWGSDSVVKT